ncbi:hypothetical protein KP509_36G001500 [Ceratopteris richardii]|uniref:Uncharacterized protein n=1 Tax=Ceratopteris richardii TaxID=49495 RepID=A0A8T2Q9W8_CERRI|nr:hypothetical protein KP509_36G001500 [Ceratopteris richardii]
MSSSTSLLRSSAVRFYLAQSITSDRVCLQGVRRPRNETSPLSRFRMPFFYRHSLLLLLDQPTAHNKTSEISLSCLVDTHLKYPPAKQSWHVHVDARHQSGCLAPKISHTFHFS